MCKGFITKGRIRRYYKKQSISISNQDLLSDIRKTELKALSHISYVIKHLNDVTGIDGKLNDIALINKKGFELERIYNNILTEIHAIHFLHDTLKYKIIEVESSSNKKVTSPHGQGNKICDIKAFDGMNEIYFEVKDASSELTTASINKNCVTRFTPMLDNNIRQWVRSKMEEALDKGANYLICRVPAWGSNNNLSKWAERVFKKLISYKINENEFKLKTFNSKTYFKGIYIIKTEGWIKLAV